MKNVMHSWKVLAKRIVDKLSLVLMALIVGITISSLHHFFHKTNAKQGDLLDAAITKCKPLVQF